MTELVECPRCKGTGKEFWPDHMTCGNCWGKGKVEKDSTCNFCKHQRTSHSNYKWLGRVSCEDESASGQFICGCQGDNKVAIPVCNVCGKDFGNSYCLNDHLGESSNCFAAFKIQFYGEKK